MKKYTVLAGNKYTKGWNSFKKDFNSLTECWDYCSEIKKDKKIRWIQIIDMEDNKIIDKFSIKHTNDESFFISKREIQDLDFL